MRCRNRHWGTCNSYPKCERVMAWSDWGRAGSHRDREEMLDSRIIKKKSPLLRIFSVLIPSSKVKPKAGSLAWRCYRSPAFLSRGNPPLWSLQLSVMASLDHDEGSWCVLVLFPWGRVCASYSVPPHSAQGLATVWHEMNRQWMEESSKYSCYCLYPASSRSPRHRKVLKYIMCHPSETFMVLPILLPGE